MQHNPDEIQAEAGAPLPPSPALVEARIAGLEEERELYRTLFSQSGDAVVLAEMEAGGRTRAFVDMNDTVCLWTEYSREELFLMKPSDLVAPEDRPLLDEYRRAFAAERWITMEMNFASRSGKVIPVELSARMFFLRGRHLALFVARDMSRTQSLRKAIAESAERWRSITESCPDHILMVNREGVIEFANHDFAGADRNNMVGLRLSDLMPQPYRPMMDLAVKNAAAGREDIQEIELARNEGPALTLEAHFNPVVVGEIVESVMVRFIDVSERKSVERALRESEARYRTFVETFIGIAYEIDPASERPVFFHGAVESITGYPEDDFLKGRVRWDDLVYSADRAAYAAPDTHAPTAEREYRIVSRTGRVVTVVELIRRMPGESVGRGLTYGVIYDTTERRRREELLKRREEELSETNLRLVEMNTALRVLLEKREEDKELLERNVSENVGRLVGPLMEKLRATGLSPRQDAYVEVLEKELSQVVSGFGRTAASSRFKLTPTELQVAALVKEGRTTKDIARMLNLSKSTIDTHRNNIRKKLDIRNQGVNLRSYLMNLE